MTLTRPLWLDTSVLITALKNHNGTPACWNLPRAVERSEVRVMPDRAVLIKLAYVLQRQDFAPQGKPPRQRAEVVR